MERDSSHCLRSWSVQLCEPINSFCFSQLELGLCYLHQKKLQTQKLESEVKFFGKKF